MADDSSNDTIPIYPPGVDCFLIRDDGAGFDATFSRANNCTVSQLMVGYLNLTQEVGKYVAAYCTNPPKDDDCPFDFCPNPDIAGMDFIIRLFSPSSPLLSVLLPYRPTGANCK